MIGSMRHSTATKQERTCNLGQPVGWALMPTEDRKRSLHRILVSRIVEGPGESPPDQRAHAFENAELPEPLRVLLGKVVGNSAQVTDADFGRAKEAGFSDDQLFELVVCAAVGEATRQYEAGLAALAGAEAP
jgi:hypothetical protein